MCIGRGSSLCQHAKMFKLLQLDRDNSEWISYKALLPQIESADVKILLCRQGCWECSKLALPPSLPWEVFMYKGYRKEEIWPRGNPTFVSFLVCQILVKAMLIMPRYSCNVNRWVTFTNPSVLLSVKCITWTSQRCTPKDAAAKQTRQKESVNSAYAESSQYWCSPSLTALGS